MGVFSCYYYLFNQNFTGRCDSVAEEGRSPACEEGSKEEVWRVWGKQLLGARVPLSETMGRRLGTEARMA